LKVNIIARVESKAKLSYIDFVCAFFIFLKVSVLDGALLYIRDYIFKKIEKNERRNNV